MDAKEAKQLGFTDEVTSAVKMTASYSLRLLPKAAADRFRAETGAPQRSHPPQTVEVSQGPKKESLLSSAPPATAEVIDISTAKAQGIEEHRCYVASVTELCTLAHAEHRVGAFVQANTPIDQVRKELLAVRATEVVLAQRQMQVAAAHNTTAAWGKITEKLNARVKERS